MTCLHCTSHDACARIFRGDDFCEGAEKACSGFRLNMDLLTHPANSAENRTETPAEDERVAV